MSAPTTTSKPPEGFTTAAYLDYLDAPERERDERRLRALEEIRAEHGPGWAIYCSAFFHGAAVRSWRLDLIEELGL